MEPIFIGSEDIREQLPEDAKRFDIIDAEFKEQMVVDGLSITSAIDACLKDGRFETLVRCKSGLETCHRSLADYLETKRKKFPRFYFIAAADLVDILSKGKHPPSVQEHFSKFTFNIGAIEWETDESDKTSSALGMYSGEGEHVAFPSSMRCDGLVEDWLTGLIEFCADSLRNRLVECMNARADSVLERWLLDSPAQLAITSTQIWWTHDINAAFSMLEQVWSAMYSIVSVRAP